MTFFLATEAHKSNQKSNKVGKAATDEVQRFWYV